MKTFTFSVWAAWGYARFVVTLLVLAGLFLAPATTLPQETKEEVKSCPHKGGWRPKPEEILPGVSLCRADLRGADLREAKLNLADLRGADLREAKLNLADLRGADLREAKLNEADLREAKLNEADLRWAILRGSDLRETDLTDARLRGGQFKNAYFQIYGAPDSNYLDQLEGLANLRFEDGKAASLVQLRDTFKKLGLRDFEREVTFSIGHQETRHYLADKDWGKRFNGVVRLVLFECTAGYGLSYGKPIRILFVIVLLMTFIYFFYIDQNFHISKSGLLSGIAYVRPEGHLQHDPDLKLAEHSKVEWWGTISGCTCLKAFYFSLMSAFRIGWRDLNIGSWITWLQPREFNLRAVGHVRIFSGLQSLFSVYLITLGRDVFRTALWLDRYLGIRAFHYIFWFTAGFTSSRDFRCIRPDLPLSSQKPTRQTRRMPICGSDIPGYVKDPKHREALEEIKRVGATGNENPAESGVLSNRDRNSNVTTPHNDLGSEINHGDSKTESFQG